MGRQEQGRHVCTRRTVQHRRDNGRTGLTGKAPCHLAGTHDHRSGAFVPGAAVHDGKRIGHEPGPLHLLQCDRPLEVGVWVQTGIISAEPKIFLHLSSNSERVMLWATDLWRPATMSGSGPRPSALKRVAHAIHPRFKPRNDPIASKDLQKQQVSPSEATCSVSFAQLSGVYKLRVFT